MRKLVKDHTIGHVFLGKVKKKIESPSHRCQEEIICGHKNVAVIIARNREIDC